MGCKMDFLIFYEHFNREIESLILIKYQLEKMGYSVVISHFSLNSYGKHVLFDKPKVVVTPWLRDNENIYRYTRFINKPKLVNLQWEQIYSINDFEIGIASTTGLALQAKHICWGEAAKNKLISEGVIEENLKVTGAVHLDFCREEFDSYYLSRVEIAKQYNLNPHKKWVLFISSFSYATYDEKSLDALLEQWGDFSEFVSISKKSRLELLQWVDELLKLDPNIEFIYRSHPSENIDGILEEKCKTISAFKIIKDYSVKQWIKVSDSIITWYSTSVAEIYAMGKSFCIVRPVTIPKIYEVDIMRDANFITTCDEFIKYICIDTNYECPINEQIFKNYFLNNDTFAYINVANYLVSIIEDPVNHENYSFTKEEEKKFKNKYRVSILVSLITDFVIRTRIKLSLFIPIKKRIFRNIEKYAFNYSKNEFERIDKNVKKVILKNEK